LTVGLNEQGLVNDFYYPYVGLDNLNTSRSMHHKIGVWVDGVFSWVDDGSWNIDVNLEANAMVSEVRMQSNQLNIQLDISDFVDFENNAFCRRMKLTNLAEKERDIRLFMHQVFEISRRGRADTALFVPDENYVLDYKGRCSLLIYGESEQGSTFDQFSVGNYGIEGKEGTYKDAEDGELTGNAVEHGGVDSVIRFGLRPAGGASVRVDYWVIAADSQYTAEGINRLLRKEGLDQRLEANRRYWQEWLHQGVSMLPDLDKRYIDAIKKSLLVIKAHTDKRGGIIASCDSSIYNYGRDYYSYVWPRDGAYAMWPLIKLGYQEEPRRFFEFCRDILTPGGYLMHKYQPDRAIGSTWHPLLHGRHKELAIQEDETAIVLFMLGEYLRYSKDQDFVFSLYNTFIQPAANFIASFNDEHTKLPHASYDLWEEKFLTHTYTVAVAHQALLVAADFADTFEYPDDAVKWRDAAHILREGRSIFFNPERHLYRKGFLLQENGSLEFDDTLDISSLFGVVFFGYDDQDSEAVAQTTAAVEEILLNKSPSGGSPRYENDHYFEQQPSYLGNPWFVTTLWIAQYYMLTSQKDKAIDCIEWTLKHALPSGVLSEQVNPSNGEPLSVTPLVWSHAELINTLLYLGQPANEKK
jgi:GH15 family glucan-1,4-alpha-glucosidase